jgi:hypothetical protein
MEINGPVRQRNYLKRTASRISILVLALGFLILGLLSLIKKHEMCVETGFSYENALSIIGGTASFMLGGIFLIAGSLRWDRLFPTN